VRFDLLPSTRCVRRSSAPLQWGAPLPLPPATPDPRFLLFRFIEIRFKLNICSGLVVHRLTHLLQFVFPADGLPLYTANRRGEFLIQAGVAVISCMAYGTYALTQYEAKKQTGEFVGSSDTVTKVAIGLGAFCVVTTPLFTWYSTHQRHLQKLNTRPGLITTTSFCVPAVSGQAQGEQCGDCGPFPGRPTATWPRHCELKRIRSSADLARRYVPHHEHITEYGSPVIIINLTCCPALRAQTDVQISEIVPVGHINPAERLVRYLDTLQCDHHFEHLRQLTVGIGFRFQLQDNKLFVMVRTSLVAALAITSCLVH